MHGVDVEIATDVEKRDSKIGDNSQVTVEIK